MVRHVWDGRLPELAGAAAEVALIDELSCLPAGFLIFNDVHLESGRYIHFEGKPLMNVQIDTPLPVETSFLSIFLIGTY